SRRIRPDRIEVARRAERTHGVRRDRYRDDGNDAQVRDTQHGAVTDLVEALGQHGGVDLVAAGPGTVDPADDVERSERHDEAGNARDRDDRTVDDPARHTDPEGEQEDEHEWDVWMMLVEHTDRVRGDAE